MLFDLHMNSHKTADSVTDIVEFLEPVVPAYRVAEVAKLLESYKVEDLLAMCTEEILEHVNVLQNKMTFEARFLYRYLQAAGDYYCTCLKFFRINIHALSTFRCCYLSLSCCPRLR